MAKRRSSKGRKRKLSGRSPRGRLVERVTTRREKIAFAGFARNLSLQLAENTAREGQRGACDAALRALLGAHELAGAILGDDARVDAALDEARRSFAWACLVTPRARG